MLARTAAAVAGREVLTPLGKNIAINCDFAFHQQDFANREVSLTKIVEFRLIFMTQNKFFNERYKNERN